MTRPVTLIRRREGEEGYVDSIDCGIGRERKFSPYFFCSGYSSRSKMMGPSESGGDLKRTFKYWREQMIFRAIRGMLAAVHIPKLAKITGKLDLQERLRIFNNFRLIY